MVDLNRVFVSCSDPALIIRAVNEANRQLPLEIGSKLADVLGFHLARYGPFGTYERLRNRSVADIFASHEAEETKLVASGELDGVSYHLYEENPTDDSDSDEMPE